MMEAMMRNLRSSDLPALAEILDSIAIFNADDRKVAMELLTIVVQQPEQQDYLCMVAADAADALLGYACFGPTPLTEGTYSLYWIAVAPPCEGQGVGTQLLRAVEGEIYRLGGRMLVLETSSAPVYAPTRQFYQKNGYSLAETIRDFYQEGEDRLTFLKRLK